MTRDKKNTSCSARLKYLFIVPLLTALICVSAHAFSQGPPPPPPPPPNPFNLFKKHKKDTTKKSETTTPTVNAPGGPSVQPAGPPPPPNPLNLFRKKKK